MNRLAECTQGVNVRGTQETPVTLANMVRVDDERGVPVAWFAYRADADLCAMTAGIDLGAAVASKFNATSEKYNLNTRLKCPPPPGAAS